MTPSNDTSQALAQQVTGAFRAKRALHIIAGGSKAFFGNPVEAEPLDVNAHCGIIEYEPSELVLTARGGTPLHEIEAALGASRQMLAFEPPMHSRQTTFGGAIATGLSGPRRACAGAVRDFVLGTTIINGKGEILKFGGQVMKNVAGYDASRLMAGAQGTLGVLLDISVKVLPLAESEITLAFAMDEREAHQRLRQWVLQGHAISASCFTDGTLYIRLSSTASSVAHSARQLGGETGTGELWAQLRNQTHPFFEHNTPLWRLSLPPATPPVLAGYRQLIEWGGALRWVSCETPLYEQAAALRGHATRYALHGKGGTNLFQPLNTALLNLHQRLKQAFDPVSILNPGRLYTDL
jgi:glycolate oxidase FAD binding subunit